MKMIKTGSTERIIKREKDRIIKECEGKEIQRKKYNKRKNYKKIRIEIR